MNFIHDKRHKKEKGKGRTLSIIELLLVSVLALSVTAYAVTPLPKGEALAKPHTLRL